VAVWREIEKAVGRQGGDAAAIRAIWPRQGVARFEISGVQTLLARMSWMRSASAFASPTGYQTEYGEMGWAVDFGC
jgi:hypothetical protein